MKKHFKVITLLLVALMGISAYPVSAFADETEETIVTEKEQTESSVEEKNDSSDEELEEGQTVYSTEYAAENEETEQLSEISEETESVLIEEETETKEVFLDRKDVAAKTSAGKYSYSITPLLEPFNEYFYVKTNNPDPLSFRFADKSSIYSDEAFLEMDYDSFYESFNLYADVIYENTKTGRVKGGYIFKSTTTDGGELVLQESDGADWKDTSVKIKLPTLIDEVDYLIKTYADKKSFFENMDAVQAGFQSICFYSGSYIRGNLIKPNKYWLLTVATHQDQNFYIFSPYDREDSADLLASTVYPYRYDSLGFPGMMVEIAKRLDSASTYEWDGYYHYNVHITYNGETRNYGGAGDIEGQGISEDKIKTYFDFENGELGLSLDELYSLLEYYAGIEMTNDVPQEDALTWERICNQVGENGSWVRVSNSNTSINGVFILNRTEYTFLYKSGSGKYFSSSEFEVGNSNYYGGDLGYARDTWVDGRYINKYFIPGEKFEDHPESNIILKDVTVPQISYEIE